MISHFGATFHRYADYTQKRFAVNIENSSSTTFDLTGCTTAVYDWLHNPFALNQDKSEAAMVGNRHNAEYNRSRSRCLSQLLEPTSWTTSRVSELLCHTRLSFDQSVGEVFLCKKCYYTIDSLSHALAAMSVNTMDVVAGAIIGLDYCNSLFTGM